MAWKPPWVHIDDVKIEALATPVLINRNPGPNDTGVLTDNVIQFDIFNPSMASFLGGLISVKVNGIDAIGFGPVIVPPFNGPRSSWVSVIGQWWQRITLDPVDIPSLSTVEVHVVCPTADALLLDETYSFVMQDKSQPRLNKVEPITRKTIRISFSQEVQETTAISATALFPWGVENLTLEDDSWVLNPLAYPWAVTGLSEPFNVKAGTLLRVSLNDQDAVDLAHPADAITALQVASGLNTVITPYGGRAIAYGGKVYLASNNVDGSIQVEDFKSNVVLQFETELKKARLPFQTPEGTYTITSEAIYGSGFVSHREYQKLLLHSDKKFILEDTQEIFDDSLLEPANYTLSHNAALVLSEINPTYDSVVESVKLITSSIVELTLKQDMTPNGPYILTVENVQDYWGNIIDPAHNSLAFRGHIPQSPELRSMDLYQFMTAFNRKQDADILDMKRFLSPLQEVLNLILADLDDYLPTLDPTTAPEWAIDAMLVSYGNPFVWFDLPLTKRRQLARILAQFYKRKGTEQGIEAALRFFFGFTTINFIYYWGGGWILGESELGVSTELNASELRMRYSFSLSVDRPLTDEERNLIRRTVGVMKPAHIHLIDILEPTAPFVPDHWQLPWSELGVNTQLH